MTGDHTPDLDDRDQRVAAVLRAGHADHPPLDPPPSGLWESIAARTVDVDTARHPSAGNGTGGALRSVPEGPSSESTATPVTRAGRAAIRRWRRVAAVAAALVLVVAGALVLVDRGDDGAEPEVVATALLTGDDIEPGSTGTGDARLAQEDGRWVLSLQVADLPTVGDDEYYEAWLLGPGVDRVQSLGTIDRAGRFVVPDGLDLADFPVVDVSVEPLDGDPAHSSRSVLRGDLERA